MIYYMLSTLNLFVQPQEGLTEVTSFTYEKVKLEHKPSVLNMLNCDVLHSPEQSIEDCSVLCHITEPCIGFDYLSPKCSLCSVNIHAQTYNVQGVLFLMQQPDSLTGKIHTFFSMTGHVTKLRAICIMQG